MIGALRRAGVVDLRVWPGRACERQIWDGDEQYEVSVVVLGLLDMMIR